MRNLIIITFFAAFIVFAVSCKGGSTNAANNPEMKNAEMHMYYTCTMHPQVHEKQAGKCPICGMELVEKELADSDTTQMHEHTDTMQMN
jgi:Cu(I)/Ag(I) efflux system membrane fusion protein